MSPSGTPSVTPVGAGGVSVRRVGPESAELVLSLVREAFSSRPTLDPPADALLETPQTLATRLALGGGLVARLDGEPVGCLILDPVGDTVYLRRFGVTEQARGQGVALALVRAAVEGSVGRRWMRVLARQELPENITFWQHRGFTETRREHPYIELTRPAAEVVEVPTPSAMRDLAARLAADLHAGDLLVLTGDLGAGKTTFTQGLGAALQVAGPITSPTFVIAREHAPTGDGPGLVHVDAYRLGSSAELDDLDLDTSLDDVVTVVEWGEGLAENLAESRIELRFSRVLADPATEPEADREAEPRLVEIQRLGPRWVRPR